MLELPWIIADFLKLSIIMVFALFMMFLTFGIGFYVYGYLESHIIEVV